MKEHGTAWGIFAGAVLAFQALASAFLVYMAYSLNMIPARIIIFGVILLAVMLILNYVLFFAGKNKTRARAFRRLIAFLLSVAITFCSVYMGNMMKEVNATVENITNVEPDEITAVATLNVYTLSVDVASTLTDCNSYKFGVVGNNEGAKSYAAMTKINEALNAEQEATDFLTVSTLASALYEGKVRAMVVDQNFVEIIKETDAFSDFSDKTKLITQVKITAEELEAAKLLKPFSYTGDDVVTIDSSTSKVESVSEEPFIIYISGSDTREQMFTVSRSDVNILMVVNPQTKQILLINTPRDFFIPNPVSSSGSKDKLTHLGIYGVDCSIAGLENLYWCDINYYVQINFTGAETLVDDLGGITIDNPQSFYSRGYDFPAGEITLNGAQAVVFARERYSFASGDNMRGQNQMRLITAIIDKLTSSPTLFSSYKKILSDLDGFIVTNMESEEIDNLVKMQLNDWSSWDIKTYSATGYGGSDYTYSMPGQLLYVTYPNEGSVIKGADLIDRITAGEILTDEMVG